jgi:hypothetical protein
MSTPAPIKRSRREMLKLADTYGFVLRRVTPRGHQQWQHPDGSLVVTSGRLGDPNVLLKC